MVSAFYVVFLLYLPLWFSIPFCFSRLLFCFLTFFSSLFLSFPTFFVFPLFYCFLLWYDRVTCIMGTYVNTTHSKSPYVLPQHPIGWTCLDLISVISVISSGAFLAASFLWKMWRGMTGITVWKWSYLYVVNSLDFCDSVSPLLRVL